MYRKKLKDGTTRIIGGRRLKNEDYSFPKRKKRKMKKRKTIRFFEDIFTRIGDKKKIKFNIKGEEGQGMSSFAFNMQNHFKAINKINELNQK